MRLTPAEIRAVVALAVGMFCVQVDFFALNLALPRMAVDLNQTTTNMQWVISAYMIAVGAAMIPGGRLGDLRGHRRIVVAGLAVIGGASLVCGLSSSYGLLIGFRALQGLGAAALFTVSVAAISNAVAKDHRAVAIGALFGIANIGTALGPFIGGVLTEQLSWRWVFFLNVPLSAVAIFCCLRWLPAMSPAGATVRIDWLGLILVSCGIVAVAYAVDRAGEWGWGSPKLIGLLALAVVLFVIFIVVERRVRDPLIDLTLFRNRAFVLITVVDPSRAGEAAGVNLTVMVTIAGVAVALAGTLIELGGAGTADIAAATQGVVRLVSLLSLIGSAVLLAISLIGRRTRQASEIASPAS
jgi:MFS family permease